MSELPNPSPPPPVTGTGWGFLKVLGLIIALIVMLGFGVCGLCGVLMAVNDPKYATEALTMGAIGLAISVAFFFLVRAIIRSGRPK